MKIARRLRVVVSALVIVATGLLLPRTVAAAPPIIVGGGAPTGYRTGPQGRLFIAGVRAAARSNSAAPRASHTNGQAVGRGKPFDPSRSHSNNVITAAI
jgi:hypothetical protein